MTKSPAPSIVTSSKNSHVDIVEERNDLSLGMFVLSPNDQITELLHISQVNTFTRMTYLQEKEC